VPRSIKKDKRNSQDWIQTRVLKDTNSESIITPAGTAAGRVFERTPLIGPKSNIFPVLVPINSTASAREAIRIGAKYAVIFMTAHDNPQWQQRAKKAGAVAYLREPFDERSQLDAIQLACGEEA
jgi:DNA-binding NarL/FixJ family response regulator